MTSDRLKYAACAAVGYADGSREHSVATVAMDHALDCFPTSHAVAVQAVGDVDWNDKRLKRRRKQEERELYETTKEKTVATISANPQAYGFGPIAMWFIWILVSAVVRKIVDWLMSQRYSSGGDAAIQAAISARNE